MEGNERNTNEPEGREGRREEGRKEGRKEVREEGKRKEGYRTGGDGGKKALTT